METNTDDQTAAEVAVTTTNLNGNLSAADDTVQKALETLDDMAAGTGAAISGTPASPEVAVWSDATHITGMTYANLRAAMDLEAGTDFYSTAAVDALVTSAALIAKMVGQDLVVDALTTGSFTSTAADTYRGFTLGENTADTNVANQTIHYTADVLNWKNESGVNKVFLFAGDTLANDTTGNAATATMATAVENPISILASTQTLTDMHDNYVITGAYTITFPTVDDGDWGCFQVYGAHAAILDPNVADLLILDGVAQADGVAIVSDGTTGNSICFQYYDATGWISWGNNGFASE